MQLTLVAPFNLRLSCDVAQRLARAPGTKQALVVGALRAAVATGILTAKPLPRNRGVVQTFVNLPADLATALSPLREQNCLSAFTEQALRVAFGMQPLVPSPANPANQATAAGSIQP